jgi:ribosomal protein S18 acetylase RimI-like enzyme/glycosyltransferase involved in cell wall biosynthesis
VRNRFKKLLFGLLGKDPEAVVVSFLTGDEAAARSMAEEIRRLEPDRRHFEVREGSYSELRRRFRHYRIGIAPVLFDGDPRWRDLRRAAFLLAPTRILAYNARLERHHLRLRTWIASLLFVRGVPLDRIWLRPWWMVPWKKDRSVFYRGHQVFDGRAPSPARRKVAVLSPYLPWPLSHGGAVRIFYLLRECAREFDIVLYAFSEEPGQPDLAPVLEFLSRVYIVRKPRYREPRWSTPAPPEVHEYRSPGMQQLIAGRNTDLLQVEYTQLASYGGDVLVEHDVTFDLYGQVHARRGSISTWWDWKRWRYFEQEAVRRFRRVVVMSEKDRALLPLPHARVIENGVDLERFQPEPETPGRKILFIGSFRHFPNIVAFRFFFEQVWPLIHDADLTVVAGPDPWVHWKSHADSARPPQDPRMRMLEFVADVRPLYVDANLVIVPTLVSAGTNIKVLEALAMQRAVVSTTSGCAGLGLTHEQNVFIANEPESFASVIGRLLSDTPLRLQIAAAGRAHVEQHYDWRAIGNRQRDLWRELLPDPIHVRPLAAADLPRIAQIEAPGSWQVESYLTLDTMVADVDRTVVGFLVSRETAPGEREILNLAVDAAYRRSGVARRLLARELERSSQAWFLEVRESNLAAQALYSTFGFVPSGTRRDYYENPRENAITMRR